MKRVVISGYFNPIHVGHLEYIQKAKALGDYLIVIVNNDQQVRLKGREPFMSEADRLEIVKNIKGVDEVFLSIDTDRSVCQSIRAIHDRQAVDIVANGGDRTNHEVPEDALCQELGIERRDGLGDKIRSSSELVKQAVK